MEIDVTWGKAIKVWWSMLWITVVFCLIIGIGVGLIFGVVKVILTRIINANPPYFDFVQTAFVVFGAFAGQIYGVKKILKKRYRDFRVMVIGQG